MLRVFIVKRVFRTNMQRGNIGRDFRTRTGNPNFMDIIPVMIYRAIFSKGIGELRVCCNKSFSVTAKLRNFTRAAMIPRLG